LIPKLQKDTDKLIHDRLKVLEKKITSKLREKVHNVDKHAKNAEKKADTLKTAILRVQEFASKVQDKTKLL
jgi:hypothetical protein